MHSLEIYQIDLNLKQIMVNSSNRLVIQPSSVWLRASGFIAPEVMEGIVGWQCDVYSMGVVIYYLLTGNIYQNNMDAMDTAGISPFAS